MISRRMLWAAQHLMKAMLVGVLTALAIPLVHAQSQDADCLAAGVVSALAQERGGQTWVYASADKTAVQSARCVSRRGSVLSYRTADGQDRTLEWIGTSQQGHWYRLRRIGTWFERYADRNDARLPPAPAIYAAIATTDDETLMIVRLVPPVRRITVQGTIEYQAYLKPSADPSLPMAWSNATKGLDYRPAPRRGAGGAVEGLYAYNSSSMSPDDAEAFHRRYSPAVLDFVEARFFDQPFPVSLLEVVVPRAGPVGVRAGVTAVRPQTGLRPPEEVTPSFAPDAPLQVFVHVMLGRPLERDATVVHRIRAVRGNGQAYQFTSNPEDWKAGWTEYWLQHPLPPGRLTPGTYTIEWQFGTTAAAIIPVTIRSR